MYFGDLWFAKLSMGGGRPRIQNVLSISVILYFCFPKENAVLFWEGLNHCWHRCLYLVSGQSPSMGTLVLHCGSIARHSCCRFYCASSELVSYKGIVQHDREFQPPRYLGIGRLMIAVHRFNTLKANTIWVSCDDCQFKYRSEFLSNS